MHETRPPALPTAADIVVDLRLAAAPWSPRLARRVAQVVAEELGRGQDADDVALVVSELVTNAERHGSGAIRLHVEAGADADLLVEVVDDEATSPVVRSVSANAVGGHGLRIVAALATRAGWYPVDGPGPGKAVWAQLGAGSATAR